MGLRKEILRVGIRYPMYGAIRYVRGISTELIPALEGGGVLSLGCERECDTTLFSLEVEASSIATECVE